MYAQDSPPTFGWNYLIRGGFHIQIDLALDRLDIKNQGNRVAPSIFIFSNQSMDDHDDFLVQDMKSTTPLGSLEASSSVVEPQVAQTKETLRYASPGPRTNITHKGPAKKYAHSLAYAFYGDRFNQEHTGRDTGHVGARKQLINVGSPGDGFYTSTNYIMW
ncbi:unnamed protein product [Echinostoma caproni]|uniref:Glyco_hydro_92N domain-containing protein n=1 Tax=Echinostoma caproni TaxID=27848 RepID=A0A183ANC9_9TREM|nr:unnamed protein product [Echinostoma caproni]